MKDEISKYSSLHFLPKTILEFRVLVDTGISIDMSADLLANS